jgi:predicted CXXCH cytochrome family protein
MSRLAAILVFGLMIFSGAVNAGEWKVPFPHVPKAATESCVRDTAFMRENHMELLLHQRDDTVHKGIRPKRTALTECLTCHAVPGADKKPVTYKDPKHFCRACHDYAAVSIDCFACHNSVPDTSEVASQ